MELNEAFKVIVEKINENFKEGLYDINDAGVIVNSIGVIGKALSVVKQPEQTITTSTSEIEDVCHSDCAYPVACNNDGNDTEIVDLPKLN
jgi:hypothetical protein